METIGERVRSLRRSAGLSQEELAAGRFSKEYVSQIERGRRGRPSRRWSGSPIGWRPTASSSSTASAGGRRADRGALVDAERLLEEARYDDALQAFADMRALPGRAPRRRSPSGCSAERHGRASASGSSTRRWPCSRKRPRWRSRRVHRRRPRGGRLPGRRRPLLGVEASPRRSSSSTRRSCSRRARTSPSDRLRSDIFHWRARCHRRNRDWVAAQDDIERALELAEACADDRRAADALFQASLVAQREGRWVLARTYAERSRTLFDAARRPRDGRAAAEQPRGAQPPPRRRRSGDRAARGGVRDVRRAGPRGRCRLRLLVARRRSSSIVAIRRCEDERAEGARPPRRSRRPSAGDRHGAAHPRPLVCGHRASSTKPRSGSRRRTRPSAGRGPWAIAAMRGWPRAMSRPYGAATQSPPASTGEPRWRSARS